jgi:hypothetical protein
VRGLIAIALIAACGGEYRPARDTYNDGVAALASGDHEKAEKLLVEARSEAGVDPDLRFRAAFDLGVAYAEHSKKVRAGQDEDIQKALELAQQSVSWFSDAARLDTKDKAAAENLAIARARVQQLTDELRKSEGTLEARLEAVIHDQREVLDETRIAWFSIKHAGGADPLAQQGQLTHLADRERGVVSEVGVVSDLAADEIDAIGKKPQDKRDQREQVRVIQLKAVDLYLQDARSRIAEARRKLQDLAAETGIDRAEAALVALKRAREQLLDPVAVLKGIAQDELGLVQDTELGGGGASVFDPKRGAIPGWLAPAPLAERQGGLRDRLDEIKTRLSTMVVNDDAVHQDNTKPQDPKTQKLLAQIRAGLPSVEAASEAMNQARGTLAGNQLTEALEHEHTAIEAMARAIEQFSDLKQTIELAYAEQTEIGTLLAPPTDNDKKLDPRLRGKQTTDALARNVDRMTRLKGLIADQLAEVEAHANQPPPQQPGAGSADPKAEEAQKQQLEAAKQQFAQAEVLRGEAAAAINALTKSLAASKTDAKKPAEADDPLVHQKTAEAKLEELRKLFFSVIEHLQQLIRDQGETRDQTSAISGATDFERAPKLPGLSEREDGHGKLAKAIADALAAQADAAGKGGQQQQQGPDPKTLAQAAEEVRQANTSMGDAKGAIDKARDTSKQSQSPQPAVEGENKAIEHLEAALKLLQPPQNNKKRQQQKQQQQQDEQKQQQQQQQQQGAGQRARDDDARQQKKRREQQHQSDPVEKDW